MSRTRGRIALLALAVALVAPSAAHAVRTPAFRDADQLHVVAVKALGPRLFELRLTTPLLTAPTNVQVLLPGDYDEHPGRRYPVLYLFHGTSGGASDWTKKGAAEQTTAGRDLITVMPDAGVDSDGGSYFADWVNGGRYGPPEWETWHIGHLIPWIDSQLRTIAARSERAIAGLSQGGFGAMTYAARHPDMFGAVATFSGIVDISANPLIAVPLSTAVINGTEVGLLRVPPNTIFGDRVTDEINWAAHDPATLAGNLPATSLYAYAGNGNIGPLDPPGLNPGATAVESGAHELTALFHRELVRRGIPVDYHDYGPGTHTWPYWTRDLRDVMPALMRDFAHPDPPPATIDYESADAHYAQWGWDVAIQRPAREFSSLLSAGARGFTLTGSGSAVVRTPADYQPRATAAIAISTRDAHIERSATVADDGSLRVDVPLGPGNPAQQFTLGATTAVYSTRVTIDAPARAACSTALRVRLRGAIRSARATSGARRLRSRRTAHTVTVALTDLPSGAQHVRIAVRMRTGQRRTLRRDVRVC